MSKYLRQLLFFIVFGVLVILVHHVFRVFPLDQAVIVALFGTWLVVLIQGLSESEGFVPFRVHIEPKWYELYRDYGLVRSEEEWLEVTNKRNAAPGSEYNVFKHGITFTVIQPGLIYRDDRKEIVSRLKFDEHIREIVIFKKKWNVTISPKLYVLPLKEGLELGITTPESELRQSDPRFHWQTRVPVAVLPYNDLPMWQPTGLWLGGIASLVRSFQNLASIKAGWTSEVGEENVYLHHKYFDVWHCSV